MAGGKAKDKRDKERVGFLDSIWSGFGAAGRSIKGSKDRIAKAEAESEGRKGKKKSKKKKKKA